jgi:spermidine synthase
LRHGRITHGLQYQDPDKRGLLTTYYGVRSGIGLAFQNLRRQALLKPQDNLRIGLVGLGVGTLAVYAHPGDYLRIYEINPAVVKLSLGLHPLFTYLRDCRAQKELVLGDARISMEHEAEKKDFQSLDILAIDAFSSDAIPVHLLTREAMGLYLQHVQPGGIIAFHISNRYLNLQSVLYALADHYQLTTAMVVVKGNDMNSRSTWVLLSRDQGLLKDPMIWDASKLRTAATGYARLWTDDFSTLFQCLK